MASEVLQKTRKINKTLQTSGGSSVSFNLLAETLGEVLGANIYVISAKGKVLGLYLTDVQDSSVIEDEETKLQVFPQAYTQSVLKINETLENLTGEKVLEVFPYEQGRLEKYTTIVPILGSGQRLGTLVVSRYNDKFTDDDLVISEYSATVIGMEILRGLSEEMEVEMRKTAVVQMAIGTLSYSELEAVEHIFKELEGNEGLLVASRIADRVGITRSVIVNALRKFESAGVIESRSLGMKGTHIKILNDKLIPIIFITSRNTNIDELMAITLGGDDFITKPYNTQILLARINALIKRAYPNNSNLDVIEHNGFKLNILSSTIEYNGNSEELTKNEMKILYYLLINKGKIVSRAAIMEYLWDSSMFVNDNTLTVNITRIRNKIEEIGLKDFIKTKRGQGYII